MTTSLRKLNDSSSRLWQMQSLHDGLQEILSATIELVGADKGNVQILNTEGVLTMTTPPAAVHFGNVSAP